MAPGPESGKRGVKVHCFATGRVREKRGERGVRRYLPGGWSEETLPVNVFAVEHPDGVCVFDTGQTARAMRPGYFPRWYPFFRLARFELFPDDEAGAQLRARGLDPGSVRWVVLSHLHTDHAGGLAAFVRATLVVSRVEWRRAQGRRGRLRGYLPLDWPSGGPVVLAGRLEPADRAFAWSHDVAGDGSMTVVPTPGHTPGHVSLVVRTPNRTLLLGGDAAHGANALEREAPEVARWCEEEGAAFCATHDDGACARAAASGATGAPPERRRRCKGYPTDFVGGHTRLSADSGAARPLLKDSVAYSNPNPSFSFPDAFVCPADGGPLAREGDEALRCERCDRRFPLVAGIPDLRLRYADEYVSWEEDLERARELAEHLEDTDLAGLLRMHWRRSGKPEELADRFLAGDMATIERSEAYVGAVERERDRPLGAEDRFLEVGCGTAGLAVVAARRAGDVVASDVSMRWLVLARKRLGDLGLDDVALVCCSAEEPPFEPGSFDVVAASDVVEHVPDQRAFAAGCARVLRAGGMLFLATPNRFSLGLEPHVRLWGVGWLPRRLARRYVERARGAPYDHVRLLSSFGLRKLLRAGGLHARLVAPEIPPGTQALYSGLELSLVRRYNGLRALRPVHAALLVVGPFFHVFATKGSPP